MDQAPPSGNSLGNNARGEIDDMKGRVTYYTVHPAATQFTGTVRKLMGRIWRDCLRW